MAEFYYLNGRETKGPYSIQDFLEMNLPSETLVWKKGLENWQKLRDFPELSNVSAPPPPPENPLNENFDVSARKTENSGLKWLIIWIAFHLFALLMSYSRIEVFNSYGDNATSKFWPFVEFTKDSWIEYGKMDGDNYVNVREDVTYFKGIFTNYDWTESAFYVGVALLIFTLTRLGSNKPN